MSETWGDEPRQQEERKPRMQNGLNRHRGQETDPGYSHRALI